MSQIKSIIVTKLKTNKMEQTAVEYNNCTAEKYNN